MALAIVLLACLVPGSARAQETESATLLEAVTVTAQKREENVQEVPISMDVFTGLQVEDAGIMDMRELTYYSPNLYSKQNVNANMVIIRGLSSHNVAVNTPAGLFVDGINYPLTSMQNPDLLDIERIEVLRGPQGTLYGRNTESGAINIITKQPDNEIRGKVYLEPGFYDAPDRTPFVMRSGLSFSGPILEDELYVAAALQSMDTEGYTFNEYNDNDEAGKVGHKTGQAKLRWTPTERWDVSLVANAFENDDGYGYLHYVDGASASSDYTVNWDGPNNWKDENNGQALSVRYKGDAVDVSSITTRNDFETNFQNDGEFGPLLMGDQVFMNANTSYSQEVRVSSAESDSPFEWLAGVFYFHDENDALAAWIGNHRETDWDTDGYALFGQAAYTFFDRLKLTVGLRWDYQDSEGTQTLRGGGAPYSAEVDHSEMLPKVSLSFDATDNVLLYATVAKGLLAGGYNSAFANGSDTLTFKPETTVNYEVGMKSEWLDKRLILNLAAFHISIEDKQVEEWLAGPAVRAVTNAAEASSTGFELEAQVRPYEGWSLFGGVGYADAVIEDWVSEAGYDYKDKRLTHAPKYTYNAAAQYDHSSGLYGRMDMLGISSFYTDAENEVEINGYQTFNLRLGYRGEDFDLSVWSKNIFDKRYFKCKSYYFGGHIAQEGAPRSIGTTLTYHF